MTSLKKQCPDTSSPMTQAKIEAFQAYLDSCVAESKSRAAKGDFTPVKMWQGSYLLTIENVVWEIKHNDERDSSWFNRWIAADYNNPQNYTDDYSTMSQVIQVLKS